MRGEQAPLHSFAQAVGETAAACMPGDAGPGLQYLKRHLLSLLEIHYGPEVWDPLPTAELHGVRFRCEPA